MGAKCIFSPTIPFVSNLCPLNLRAGACVRWSAPWMCVLWLCYIWRSIKCSFNPSKDLNWSMTGLCGVVEVACSWWATCLCCRCAYSLHGMLVSQKEGGNWTYYLRTCLLQHSSPYAIAAADCRTSCVHVCCVSTCCHGQVLARADVTALGMTTLTA